MVELRFKLHEVAPRREAADDRVDERVGRRCRSTVATVRQRANDADMDADVKLGRGYHGGYHAQSVGRHRHRRTMRSSVDRASRLRHLCTAYCFICAARLGRLVRGFFIAASLCLRSLDVAASLPSVHGLSCLDYWNLRRQPELIPAFLFTLTARNACSKKRNRPDPAPGPAPASRADTDT